MEVTINNPRMNGDHALYEVKLVHRDTGVTVTTLRRYTEFAVVLKEAYKMKPKYGKPPSKKMFGNASRSLLEARRKIFQKSLRQLSNDKISSRIPAFATLIGLPTLRERKRALALISLQCQRICFRWWLQWTNQQSMGKLKHKAEGAMQHENSELSELRTLQTAVGEAVGESALKPSDLAVLVKREMSKLNRASTEQDTHTSSVEDAILGLSRSICHSDSFCTSALSAIELVANEVEQLRTKADSTTEVAQELNNTQAKLIKTEIVISDIVKLANSIKGEGDLPSEDAVYVIEDELETLRSSKEQLAADLEDAQRKFDEYKDREERNQEERKELLSRERAFSLQSQITEMSKKLSEVKVGTLASSDFAIEKAAITDYEDAGKAVYFTIEAIGNGGKWRVQKRYRMFASLKKRLGSSAKGVPFPGKQIGKANDKKLKERMRQLNTFLLVLISKAKGGDPAVAAELSEFLDEKNSAQRGASDEDDDDDLDSTMGASVATSFQGSQSPKH
eukprot:TRINITY_DN19386_c0_g1_i1.p1 TRINITY_DN19386_c0_g1~~TRINITY_DN19386_c0_g1_i1.p1  ORF type:complete len:507 (+),score=134.64 TRINITY_DN19386_c0_g1_i1:87-1607(+)